jgi:hypothetical protein
MLLEGSKGGGVEPRNTSLIWQDSSELDINDRPSLPSQCQFFLDRTSRGRIGKSLTVLEKVLADGKSYIRKRIGKGEEV